MTKRTVNPADKAGPKTDKIVDRDLDEPAYIQIFNLLKQQIATGVYLPGSRLPSESELRRVHQVSPMTIRRSVKMLLDQGIVKTVKGSGTFVNKPNLSRVTFSLEGFSDLFRDKQTTRVKLLDVRTIMAGPDEAIRLQVAQGTRIILLKRLLVKNLDPIIFHKEYLIYDPHRPIIETELEVTELYGLFEGNGLSFFKRGDLSIETMALNQEEASLLNTLPLTPAFRIEHLFYDFEENPISWGQFICRGDQLLFKTSVGVSPE